MADFSFTLVAGGKNGPRAGVIETERGRIHTPAFMPVGTAAAVKTLAPEDLWEVGVESILANTYHLHLRPGEKTIRRLGGLHRFMNWSGPILTDSGGFQVFSLGELRKVSEEGVYFRSHLDGTGCFLSPEKAVEIQEDLGSDMLMVLDECLGYPASREDTSRSLEMTVRWAARCLRAWKGKGALFGIVQGGSYEDLRKEAVQRLVELNFPGYALGGFSVGEPHDRMMEMVGATAPLLPADKPRYLMGVGTPEDLVQAVERGVDFFDCVLPTRNARNGQLFTSRGKIVIRNALYREDAAAADSSCDCPVCRSYSRAYLRHLHQSGEVLGLRLNTLHNIAYYERLMRDMRSAILQGEWETFRKEFFAARQARGGQNGGME